MPRLPAKWSLQHLSRSVGRIACAAVATVLHLPGIASATYPDRPLRLIVPFPAGGPNDVVARVVADPLGQLLGQPVVVDNRPGAGGTLGSEAGAKAAPDGHVLTLGSTSSHSLPTLLGQKIGYSPSASFAPVGLIGQTPTVLLVTNRLGNGGLETFIRTLRSQPGRFNYGSSGVGTLNHLITESFKQRTGTFIVHIPYRGTGQAMTDLAAGQIDVMFDAVVTAAPQVRAGRVRALAVAGSRRVADLPDVPTFQESGLKDFEASLWLGVFAPVGTPAEVVSRVNAALQSTLSRADVRTRLTALSVDPAPGGPEALAAYMRNVERAWGQVVRERGIKPE